MNEYLSRSPEFDRPDYYRFARQSGLPRGTFDPPKRWHIACTACLAAIALAVAFLLITK